jgi:hypothetical protein
MHNESRGVIEEGYQIGNESENYQFARFRLALCSDPSNELAQRAPVFKALPAASWQCSSTAPASSRRRWCVICSAAARAIDFEMHIFPAALDVNASPCSRYGDVDYHFREIIGRVEISSVLD